MAFPVTNTAFPSLFSQRTGKDITLQGNLDPCALYAPKVRSQALHGGGKGAHKPGDSQPFDAFSELSPLQNSEG